MTSVKMPRPIRRCRIRWRRYCTITLEPAGSGYSSSTLFAGLRQQRPQPPGRGRRRRKPRLQLSEEISAGVRQVPGQQFEERAAQAEDIGAGVDLTADDLLGGEVVGRADDRVGARQVRW